MAGDDQTFLDAAERLRGAAEQAGTSPFAFLRNGVSGRSADGSVTVWVDALGRVRDTTIRRNTLLEGDEQRLAAAFTEAANAAARAAGDLFTPEALRRRAAELDAGEADAAEGEDAEGTRGARRAGAGDDNGDDLGEIMIEGIVGRRSAW